MNNVINVNSVSDSQYPSNQSIDNNSNAGVSAFLILAQAMSKSIDNASKSLDSQTLEEREKQAILQQLESITDLSRRKEVIEFLIKTFGSSDSSIETWLNGLKEKVQDSINQVWKMLYGYYQDAKNVVTDGGGSLFFKKIDTDDEREKKGYALFIGDAELDLNLSKKRISLLNQIKQLMQNPDEAASNLTQLSTDFQDLQSIVQKEQKLPDELAKPANWLGKQASKLEDSIKGICKGKYNILADIGMPGMAIFDGLVRLAQGIVSIPSDIIGGFQKRIIKDTLSLANQGLTDIQSAENSSSIMKGQYEIDSLTVSSRIQKGERALNNYNDLIGNSLTADSKLISTINYSNKV